MAFIYQWLLLGCMHMMHPFFVSMTDMNYNSKDKTVEISVRIFTDDLENTLRKYHSDKIDILHPADKQKMNQYVQDYIQQHLQVSVNNTPGVLKFVGYEQQEESIWSYFEIDNVPAFKTVSVTNSLLHDYTDKQINMMHVQSGDKEQNYKLDYPETRTSFSF